MFYYLFMEIFYRVLEIINWIVIGISILSFLFQFIMIAFVPLKPKKFPVTEKKNKVAILICARNESEVIKDTVTQILEGQSYPKDMFDVFVVADNCTDNTAELAKNAGAIVLERVDNDPTHRAALYPLKMGCETIMNHPNNYDLVIHLDADNIVNDDFLSLMNDCYQAGNEFARPYEGSLNGSQNFYAAGNSLFYCFDSRFGSRVRERFHLSAHVNGPGAMMAVSMLKRSGGYDCVTKSDDAEFLFNRLIDKVKPRFVEDAVVYEDMPSSFHDTAVRNKRMANGAGKLFKSKFKDLMKSFFKTGDLSFLEITSLYLLNLINVVVIIWLPLYYIYHFVFLGLVTAGTIPVGNMFPQEYYSASLWNTLIVAACIAVGLLFLFGFLMGFILVLVDYKKMSAKSRKEMIGYSFVVVPFLFVFAITFFAGGIKKDTKWEMVKRNVQ